jgi:ABC-type transport system substrate-binding protein
MDGWDITIITDRASLRAAFTSQQDYSYGAGSESEADELLQQGDYYLGSEDPTYTFIAFSMNVLRPPFDDQRIRLAALHAINRQDYIDRVYEGAAEANGLVPPAIAGALPAEELEELQPYDPERSRALIREVTGEDTISINCIFPGNETIQEHDRHLPIWLQQMEAAGFSVQQEATDTASWLSRYREKDYDSSLALNQIYETAEIPLDFHESKGPAGSNIYHEGMKDEEIDAAIAATKVITNFDDRVAAIQDVQRLIYSKGPAFIPIVTPQSRTLYHNFVKGIPRGIGTSAFFQTQEIWLDQ